MLGLFSLLDWHLEERAAPGDPSQYTIEMGCFLLLHA